MPIVVLAYLKNYFEEQIILYIYPGTTSFRLPKKYFVMFYLLSSPVVLFIALYYLSAQEQQILSYKALSFLL